MKILILIFLTLTFTSVTFAQDQTEETTGPCQKIMEACKSSGYGKGDAKEKKSLYKDCVQPLLEEPSKNVPNVSVDNQLIAACKKKKQNHKIK